jgi:hypothetical protein
MEVCGVDAIGLKDWDFEKSEKISTWNGRTVKIGVHESRIDVVGNVDVHVKAEISFGGSGGPQGSVSAGVGASDGNGNSASVDVQHDSNGQTTVSVEAEHSTQNNSN